MIKDTPLSNDDSNVIVNGINNRVKGFLAVNSTEEDKELADKILYQSETTIRGTVSGTAFEKKYTMQMVVKRDENETVTVYEINDITW